MGIVIIETDTPLPEDLRRQIQSLKGGKHGMRPKIRENTVVCGRSTHTLVTNIIESKPDVTIAETVVVDSQGQEHTISERRRKEKGRGARQSQSIVLFNNPVPETPKKVLTPQEQFKENLNRIPDKQVRTSLCNVLDSITEYVNDPNQPEEDKLQPYHLVDFKTTKDDTHVEYDLNPLEGVDQNLAQAAERYIFTYRNCSDGNEISNHLVHYTIEQFGDRLFEVIEDPNKLQQLKALAKKISV